MISVHVGLILSLIWAEQFAQKVRYTLMLDLRVRNALDGLKLGVQRLEWYRDILSGSSPRQRP